MSGKTDEMKSVASAGPDQAAEAATDEPKPEKEKEKLEQKPAKPDPEAEARAREEAFLTHRPDDPGIDVNAEPESRAGSGCSELALKRKMNA